MVDSEIATRLWATANKLWADTGLRPSQFSGPVLGLIFLRYAEKMNGRVAMFFFSYGVYQEFVSGESLPRQLFDFLGHHS